MLKLVLQAVYRLNEGLAFETLHLRAFSTAMIKLFNLEMIEPPAVQGPQLRDFKNPPLKSSHTSWY